MVLPSCSTGFFFFFFPETGPRPGRLRRIMRAMRRFDLHRGRRRSARAKLCATNFGRAILTCNGIEMYASMTFPLKRRDLVQPIGNCIQITGQSPELEHD